MESKKRANALAEQQKYEMEQNNIELESKSSTIKESKLVVAEEDDALNPLKFERWKHHMNTLPVNLLVHFQNLW